MTNPDPSTEAKLEVLFSRRSASALGTPGPTRAQLDQILLAAGTVPDHGLLRPFRFVIAEGEGRVELGRAFAAAAAEHKPSLPAGALEKVQSKTMRSPTVVVLVASPKPGKIETWEQHAAAACAGYAVLLAAHALGLGAVWKSLPFTRGRALTDLLGLAESEEMLGWIHLGTPMRDEPTTARDPLDLSACASELAGQGRTPYRVTAPAPPPPNSDDTKLNARTGRADSHIHAATRG